MATRKVFEGIKALDFTWAGVGPLTIRYLAEHGATVVRIESTSHPDMARSIPPFIGRQPGFNRAWMASEVNVNKLSLGLNLALSQGQTLARRIITTWQPDIMAENFTPRVMRHWGLDYESVKKLREDIIYFSACQQGQTGPRALMPGYGHLTAALSCLWHICGWPERSPLPIYGGVSDALQPPFGISAIIAALMYRRATGKGQHIDQSQFEVCVQHLAPMVLDYTANGNILTRCGNRDPCYAPHGVFPCRGDDRWIAIAVTSDEEWQQLCQALGKPDLRHDQRFSTFEGRRENEAELERIISEITRQSEVEELFLKLQGAGVPAGMVQNCQDLYADEQLKYRGMLQPLEHPEGGMMPHLRTRFLLSATPGKLERCYAKVGADSHRVLKEFVGLEDQEIAELIAGGVLEFS